MGQFILDFNLIYWAAGSSVVFLGIHALLARFNAKPEENGHSLNRWFTFLRFLAACAILGIQIAESVISKKTDVLCLIFAYCTLLCFLSLFVKRWNAVLNIHSTAIFLFTLAVYGVRDLYPLVTYSKISLDEAREGIFLWIKIGLLFVTAVLIPLLIPNEWVPVDLGEDESETDKPQLPNPEQTASFLSTIWFFFLEPVVLKAYRVPHLPAAQLPPLANTDWSVYLRRKYFSYLDIYSGAKKRPMTHIFLWMFRWTWLKMCLVMVLAACGQLGSPLAINRLLSYLETGPSATDIRPWFWVVLAFFSPILVTLCNEWFFRTGLILNVQVDALLTQLVFEHSLRIRVKGGESSSSSQNNGSDSTKKAKKPNWRKGSRKPQNLSGRINNLVTADLSSIAELRNWIFIFINRPVEFILSSVFLYEILGWSMFVGIGLMIVLAPIPAKIINASRRLFLERMRRSDLRVGVFGDVVSVLRMVKLFGWEQKMNTKVANIRKGELDVLRKRKVFLMFNDMTNFLVPLVSVTACFATYELSLMKFVPSYGLVLIDHLLYSTLIMNQNLTPSRVFSSLVVFEKLQQSIRFFFVNLNKFYAGLISLDRVQDFLADTELLDKFDPTSSVVSMDEEDFSISESSSNPTKPRPIGFSRAIFSWSKDDSEELARMQGSATPNSVQAKESTVIPADLPNPQRTFFLNIPDTVLFQRNQLNLIVGSTGSGKTAMLLALLGELHFIPSISPASSEYGGDPESSSSSRTHTLPESWYNLPRRPDGSGVAYAAQESWVLNETIRDNILFHSPFNPERYAQVLYQCGLERDLSLFDAGDMTEVGEKGITLSGGQKARLTLARAVYSDAEILLLDDVLAALDVHTARWIIEKCFMGDLLRDRTIILVTHNTALTLPIASFVVTLKDGWVVNQEILDDSTLHSKLDLIETDSSDPAIETEVVVEPEEVVEEEDKSSSGKLVVEEEIQIGHVSWAAIKLYASGMGGTYPVLFFLTWLGTSVLSQFTTVLQTWYLGYWASQYEGRDPSDIPVTLYLAGYVGVALSTLLINSVTTLNYVFGSVRASNYIHARLVDTIFGTTMRWLDKTPVSRIITRSTQDIYAIDITISRVLIKFTDDCLRLLSRLGAIVLFSPIFFLPGMAVLTIGLWCGSVYFKAQMSVKRELSIAKAPTLAHFGATVAGLTSIRAYGAQRRSIREMLARTDRLSRIARIFNNLQRWVAVRLNSLGGVFMASLGWYLVYVLHQSASVTGFSLNMASSFSSAIFTFILDFNALEAQSNSLERIDSYLHIEQEPKPTLAGRPPASWPTSGDLRVEGLSAKYSLDGPQVLHDLKFHVKSGERIGVVGRTGSGKSTLTLSLLRGIFTTGEIFYDGLSINKINLDALRSSITIIPQMPELISGSLRENLDPFDEHDDFTLNDALKSAGLQALQEDMPEKDRIKLDTRISAGGANFSLGQRQIIALARAIVRKSKLLILDEATSAIDYKTDNIIQSSLRNQFTGDVTLITIAHRLQTIMDADRIIVLEAGRIAEFDTPSELLKNPNGLLRSLVEQSHDKDILISMAQRRQDS